MGEIFVLMRELANINSLIAFSPLAAIFGLSVSQLCVAIPDSLCGIEILNHHIKVILGEVFREYFPPIKFKIKQGLLSDRVSIQILVLARVLCTKFPLTGDALIGIGFLIRVLGTTFYQ